MTKKDERLVTKPTATTPKSDVKTREDLSQIVSMFYDTLIRNYDVGKFFTTGVDNWHNHLEKVVDFWESRVLFSKSYEKSILPIHVDIDNRFNNTFEPAHFREWLSVWNDIVDQYYVGDNAELVKEVAEQNAKNIYLKMFLGRKGKSWEELLDT